MCKPYAPSTFGPPTWRTVHLFAASACTPEARRAYVSYVSVLLPDLISCHICSNHWKELLKTHRVEDYSASALKLFEWSYIAHDIVNKRLGKTSPTFDNIRSLYGVSSGDTIDSLYESHSSVEKTLKSIQVSIATLKMPRYV